MFIRTEFNYDMNKAGDESGLRCLDVSRAKQSFAEESDINTIIRRFKIGQELPVGVRMPTFGDFTFVSTFKEAMDAIALANEAFDAMPADIRSRFHNNPEEFLAFTSDDSNIAEARKMGLVPPEEVPVPTAAVGHGVPPHADLRSSDGRFREHTAAERAAEAKPGTVST